MIGKKLYKNNKSDMAQYTVTAQWCNKNNAHIEDKGSYYEVVANEHPEPTKDELLAALDAQYNKDKDELKRAYLDAVIYGGDDLAASIKAEIDALDEQYDADYDAIVREE